MLRPGSLHTLGSETYVVSLSRIAHNTSRHTARLGLLTYDIVQLQEGG